MTDSKVRYASAFRSPKIFQIVKELRAARLVRNMNISELSRITGIPRQSLAMWEAGTSQPHLAPLEAWAQALGYTLKIDIE